jgi:hypothetical protein
MAPLSSIQVDEARLIPLERVLSSKGLKPHREGTTTRYKNDEFNIVVSNHALWFDNAASVGGRGAIDLALHLHAKVAPRQATPSQIHNALDWLGRLDGSSLPIPSESSPHVPLESFADQAARLAIRDDERWPLARLYLLQDRRLPRDLVDHLHQAGDISATFSKERPELTGVCFLHRNLQDAACGATIRGLGHRAGTFSIGEKHAAWFAVGDVDLAHKAVLVEAPIDAISYAALKRPADTVVLSVSGSHATTPILEAAHARRWELTIGFDKDAPGHAGWDHCTRNYRLLYPDDPPPTRILPALKDWNDDLREAPSLRRGRRL